MNSDKIYDFVGVGVGPFNLGLACLTSTVDELDGIFFDKSDSFNWHPGMMLQDTTLQIPFMADLVTLADPTSPFSFLNYLKKQGRIYSFYIRENFLVLRHEYNKYCQWVIQQLQNIHFKSEVKHISYDKDQSFYLVETKNTQTGKRALFKALRLVLGTGTAPYVPGCCTELKNKAVHSSQYLSSKSELQKKKSITVLGSGQSAAEIFYDLLQGIDHYGYELNWITRSPRFFPLEYSKLTLEMTSPEYVDYFYGLKPEKRDQLINNQKHLYKGINSSLIADIFDLLYTKKLLGDVEVGLRTNSELVNAEFDGVTGKFQLDLYQHEQERAFTHETEGLVLATGYKYRQPEFIKGIENRIKWDEKGRYDVNRNYTIDHDGRDVFVQNAELHTHGFVTPDLGMACYRNSYIIKEMTGREHYPIERSIAFQQFDAPQAIIQNIELV
ncbi:lysine N(6)-hydroxylase/L-ornithine N(5)-oxygenase family protein [Fulvivirga ligni]|uniref:lysine N(6)-hydroxylase/L-ornithine N(5)-oxygenase family protein n=1 Tax=Fulvivirga ligni TaxID=2904246 RepID=UPI001F423517|nr:lysine N(6)-hydroxylase/L-ornithine N(5)-oxygenase family protein [Fulvivirga ligni]UII19034.1 lysine N(6)-hydroxylase/L-ornithine N(5)-oxygenase family protein [Fulvivirga ligni]